MQNRCALGIGAFGQRRVAAAVAVGIDHAHLLAAERAAQHGAMALPEGRLVDVELVRIDRALHDVLAEPVDAGDEHHVAKAGFGIEREDDAAGARCRSAPSSSRRPTARP